MKLRQLKRPFLCAVIAEHTARACIDQIDRLEHFADAFEINIPPLTSTDIKDVFAATDRPLIATNRRPEFMALYGYRNLRRVSETERVAKLLQGLHSGASVIDFELDTYDETSVSQKPAFGSNLERKYAVKPGAEPTEFSKAPTIVRRQRELCDVIHASAAEVIISSHTQTRIDLGTARRIGRAIRQRGADYAKIVVHTYGSFDILKLLHVANKVRSIRLPFNLMNVGEFPLQGRLLAIGFGSSWIYCRTESRHSFPGQPTAEQAARFLRRI